MQIGLYFDQSRCIGCYACVVACKDWHDIQDKEVNWMKLLTFENGKYPEVSVNWFVENCHHCAEPACIPVCPVDAITKREEDGMVVIDSSRCKGINFCDRCHKACPYHIPQFGSEPNAKAQKCDFCLDRWEQGRRPVCVDACPVNALDAGPLEELEVKYGNGKKIIGFTYHKDLSPSVIFKPQA
jgi:anaerobic dimethyl sulfoxide reductase subunit B (iron-sulfur subunit)